MIEVDHISFGYAQNRPVFSDFSWSAAQGERWAILGPSGCGKSTLLYLCAGLRFPASGQVRVNGQALTRPRPRTGLILQDFGLLPWSTVRQNVCLGLDIRNFYGPDGKHAPAKDEFLPAGSGAQVDFWLRRLGLEAVSGQFPRQISGGQRQRTAIARTLVLDPDLILMDEPFASLDAPTREDLQNLLLELCQERSLTMLIVTHSIEEAARLGQKVLVLGQAPILGQAPTRQAQVVKNPLAGQQSPADYLAACAILRQALNSALAENEQ